MFESCRNTSRAILCLAVCVCDVINKAAMQGTVKGGRRQGRQKKKWEDNIREWTGLEFAKSQRAVENRKIQETGCEVICGAPMSPAVRGQVKVKM